jgi:MYXO-CTERM domain-containing protein
MSWSNDGASHSASRRNPTQLTRWVLGAGLALAATSTPRAAQACGGFFCSAANPVNQAAERIVFAHNGDGTVTAVIEIQYQGPSENFSWLLPISSVPMGDQIAVASNVAFQRLQSATNPRYNLTTRVEGTCATRPSDGDSLQGGNFANGPSASAGSSAMGPGGVTVEAQGVVGSFEWTVISLDDALADPADAAVEWLNQNEYDVPSGAPGLLGPYLDDGLYLLALKLQKGADAGSIRPIVLTYEAELPMIPIKLTAVAANQDMGVMTWLLGEARAVPKNYNALELNEARINWFNANSTYNQVVIEAADDAGGQGFVTELSADSETLRDQVWSAFEDTNWQALRTRAEAGENVYEQLTSQYMGFDGFWESVEGHITLPAGTTFEQHRMCPFCTNGNLITIDAELPGLIETNVIEPIRLVQRLIDAHPRITRLYTTMSAAEMTVDPLFTYNSDLLPVSNIHTAERIIECSSGYFIDGAPWRIELPQGGVIRGGPGQLGSWPTDFDGQPANRRILRQSESGDGQVLEDNSADIDSSIGAYNATVPMPQPIDNEADCSVGRGAGAASWLLTALGLSALLRRRRR